jgi:hypothetical protein
MFAHVATDIKVKVPKRNMPFKNTQHYRRKAHKSSSPSLLPQNNPQRLLPARIIYRRHRV